MTNLIIDKDVAVDAVNPSWNRPFEIVEQKAKVMSNGATARFFLCRFTKPDPERAAHPDRYREYDPDFHSFGVAHVEGTKITEAWCILAFRGTTKPEDIDIVTRGEGELRRHECPNCKQYVVFRTRVLRRRVELVVTQYTCPKCGHKDVDYLD